MKLKSLKIREDLHDKLRKACFHSRVSIFDFVDRTLRTKLSHKARNQVGENRNNK